MDRRYHISPPGETTQYKVTEKYLDNEIIDINEKKTSEKIQEESYNKIIEICNKSKTGEILFFCTGEGEILEAVKELNNRLPLGNIALPFFSKMNESYRNIITNINVKLNKMH
jgi:HrpA-like RNA helicase